MALNRRRAIIRRYRNSLLTYIFLQADTSQHAAQIMETMGRCNFVQMGGRRMVHIIWGHPNLSNAVLAWDNTTEIHLGTEHRRGRFFPQVWRMWRQVLNSKILLLMSRFLNINSKE